MKPRTKRNIKIAVLVLILLALFGVIIFLLMEVMGKKAMLAQKDAEIEMAVPEDEEVVLEDNGQTVIYKGEKYVYNENITSVLCMGVDGRDEGKIGSSGQADMLMLAILDTESGKVNLWNISRDSMTDVDIYNVDGDFVRTEEMQACLAYAYGDGSHKSCENTVRSVSRLLYGMPIQSYMVLNLEGLPKLNDAVGGVEVEILKGDILPSKFKPGTKVLLKGKDVESFVRTRMEAWDEVGELDSNNNRMDRQKRYMTGFIQKALQMTKQDITTPITLFNIARKNDYIISNLNVSRVAYLASVVSKVNFTEDTFQTIPGEVVDGGKYAEYHVDDEALYQMILDTFYVKQ